MNLKHNYWFWKNVIPGRLCDDIIQYGLRNKKEKAITGDPGGRNLVKNPLSVKEIKQLKSDSTYKEGKKWEKGFDKGWGKYEKGEHYSTPTNNNKNYKNRSKKKLIYV